jgi:hypothetical protein
MMRAGVLLVVGQGSVSRLGCHEAGAHPYQKPCQASDSMSTLGGFHLGQQWFHGKEFDRLKNACQTPFCQFQFRALGSSEDRFDPPLKRISKVKSILTATA